MTDSKDEQKIQPLSEWIAPHTLPTKIEPYQRKILDRIQAGETRIIVDAPRPSRTQRAIESVARSVQMHVALYGCSVEMGHNSMMMYAKCTNPKCPQRENRRHD